MDRALDQALRVFWQKGYEGASLSDLTEAMGINRPSLYAAYGNKEALFRKALDRYVESKASLFRDAAEQPTARAAAEHILYGAAAGFTCPDSPHGCLMVRCALSSSSEMMDAIRREMANRRIDGEAMLRQRLERAQADGELPAEASPADLARFVTTILQGMSLQATSGATGDQLRAVVRTAMAAWPPAGRDGCPSRP